MGSPQGALRLRDWGLLLAEGDDAARFLHGQLTQDVVQLPVGEARLAGYCSPKGRLLATFWMWRHPVPGPVDGASDGAAASNPSQAIALACSADVLPATAKRLSMFVLRSRCRIVDASDRWALWGLAGGAAHRWLGLLANAPVGAVQARGDGVLVRLPDAEDVPRWLLMLPLHGAVDGLPALSHDDWAWLEVRSGVARVVAATVERFVPQMVNLELTGGVNFKKGCYPGQEVVARSQYRGTLKRRMHLVHAEEPLFSGQEVFHDSDPDQPAGLVVLAASSPAGGFEALVELKTALASAPGRLQVGGGDLQLGSLPYPLPAEATLEPSDEAFAARASAP